MPPEELTKEELTGLLREAEKAHGKYETEELGGVRDEEWARWYAEFIVNARRDGEVDSHRPPARE